MTASSTQLDGRRRRFTVAASNVGVDGPGELVGTGEGTRVVVDAERFLGRVGERVTAPRRL